MPKSKVKSISLDRYLLDESKYEGLHTFRSSGASGFRCSAESVHAITDTVGEWIATSSVDREFILMRTGW